MCGCDTHYVCPRCTGTPADPFYVADEPRDETEQARDDAAKMGLLAGFLASWGVSAS